MPSRGRRQQGGILRHRFGRARRSSRTAGRSGSRRPDWRDDGPRAARSARRSRRGVVSRVGMATMVRRSGGTPSRSARPGSSVAPKPPVIARLTSIKRRIDGRQQARPAPSTTSVPAPHAEPAPEPSSGRNEDDAGRRRRRCRHSPRCRSRANRRRKRQAGGAKADRAFEGATAAADQVIAGIALRRSSPVSAAAARCGGQGAPGDLRFRQPRCRGPSARWRCDRGCGWRNPCRRRRRRRAGRRRPGSPPRRASPSRRRRSGACW